MRRGSSERVRAGGAGQPGFRKPLGSKGFRGKRSEEKGKQLKKKKTKNERRAFFGVSSALSPISYLFTTIPPTVWVASLEPSGLRAPSPRGHPRPRVLLSDPSPAAPNKSPFAFPCPSPWVQSRGRGGGRAGAADHLVAAQLRYPTRRPGRAPTNPRPKVT